MINSLLIGKIREFLPYSPNDDQIQLLEHLASFILEKKSDNLFLLLGYAGTGKTSMIGALVQTLNFLQLKSVLLAPTGRAAKVFSFYSHQTAYTIHKKIYRQKAFTGENSNFLIADNLHKDTLFIVDEASMISDYASDMSAFGSGNVLADLLEYVYSGEGCSLILIGDNAQLPPVGQQFSPALNVSKLSSYGLKVSTFVLKQIARQSLESGILFNATLIRNLIDENQIGVLPQLQVKEFPDMNIVYGNDLLETLTTSMGQVGIEDTIIITRSNKRANVFNQGIRNSILYREEELSTGDLLLIAKNNYFWSKDYKEIDFIANGDIAQVLRVRKTMQMHGFRFADVTVKLIDYNIELDVMVLLDTLESEAPALSREQNEKLLFAVLDDYQDARTKREKYLKLKADPYFNALQIKYAYSVTCHKAQGGQWKHVYLDMGYIQKDAIGIDFYRWLYTALTRATEHLWLINPDKDFLVATEIEG